MEEKKGNNKFLATEKISKLLKMFAIPCVLSILIQSIYNIVDQIFIGNCETLGSLGNTATGIVYPLTVIALAIGLLLGDGTSASLSISQGRNQTDKIHKSVGTSIVAGTILSFVLLGLCIGLKDTILSWFGATNETLPFASVYVDFIIYGFPFYILSTILNPIVRADGSPKFAMLGMVSGAIINMILDPIFIFACGWGMFGAAFATYIGQVVSFIIHFVYLFKSKSFKLKLSSFIPDFSLLFLSVKLGVSSFLTQVAIVIISVMNNIILKTYLPEDLSAIGLFTIAFKVFGIVISICIGVSVGAQPILGYNYGANKKDRVLETLKKVLLITGIVCIIATILFIAFPNYLYAIFGYSEVSDFGLNIFRIYLCTILLGCMIKVISIFFQAIGKPVRSMLIAILRDVVFVVPLAIILSKFCGINIFLLSGPIADILGFAVAITLLILFVKNELKSSIQDTKTANVKLLPSVKGGVIITIAREHGAGGREIGKKLAEKLKIPYYNKEVTALTAKESGLSEQYIKNIGSDVNIMYDLYLSTEANQDAISAQEVVLRKIADKGSCVIVGRASDYVLRDYNTFNIFVYANTEFKKNRIMQNYGDDEETAISNCEKSDKRRALYYKNITGKKWGDKENYNLCIDSSIGIDNIVDMIYRLLKGSNK